MLLKPYEIYRPIGMEADRFRWFSKRGTVKPCPGETVQGKPQLYTPTEASKAALINYYDHMGYSLEATEMLVHLAFDLDVLPLIVKDEGPDYFAMSRGISVLAMLPNVEQLPGGPGVGRALYSDGTYFEVRPLDGVTLFAPAEWKNEATTMTYTNMSALFRFFAEKIGFKIEELSPKK